MPSQPTEQNLIVSQLSTDTINVGWGEIASGNEAVRPAVIVGDSLTKKRQATIDSEGRLFVDQPLVMELLASMLRELKGIRRGMEELLRTRLVDDEADYLGEDR